jgi:hypothetical protein
MRRVRPCVAEDERGWKARLTVDDEVVVYCPDCDEREFGAGEGPRSRR